MSFEEIMEDMLSRVPDSIDKREGGIIYTAIAPVAAMVAEMFFYSGNIRNATIPDTSACAGDDLTRKCAEHGVNRYPASNAVRLGLFTDFSDQPAEVEIGSRFAAEGLAYSVTERITAGRYKLRCEQSGMIGNNYFGAVLPLDSTHLLGTAILDHILIPGEEEETDEALRTRFYIVVNAEPYGGNLAHYEQWILAIPGVGNVKIFPTPNNRGGKVHCVIVDPDNRPCSETMIQELQEMIDPYPHGLGLGIAPIGHDVTVSTVDEAVIHVAATLQLKANFTIANVLPDIQAAIKKYMAELAFVDNVVRIAFIEAAMLGVEGVRDISLVSLNGNAQNISLSNSFDNYQIPVLGELHLSEVS